MAAQSYDIAILGGGLAGLAASMRCQAPVFEAAPRAGGVGSSDTVDGFTFDRGIHVLNTKSPNVLGFLRDIGVEMAPRNRIAEIYSHKEFTAYPFQVNTAGLPLGLRARCVWNFLNRDKYAEPTNYEEWMYKNIGETFARTFLIPYSEKFWGVHPSEMTFEWTGTKVPKPSTWQVLRGALWSRQTAIGSNALFHYPQNGPGYGTIAQALQDLSGEVHTNHRAVHLDVSKRRVTFENGNETDARVLISSIPLPELVGIADDVPEPVREAAGKLRTNSILVVNLGIGRPNVANKHWVHFPEKNISFFRLSFPSNFSPGVVPPGHSSISCEVAYRPGEKPDPEHMTERVIQDLQKVGLLRPDDPVVLRHTFDIRYGYCIYDKERKPAVRTIRGWLESHDILPTGRYGLWSYFWSDEAINSGRNSADKALKMLGKEVQEPGAVQEPRAARAS